MDESKIEMLDDTLQRYEAALDEIGELCIGGGGMLARIYAIVWCARNHETVAENCEQKTGVVDGTGTWL